jgi:uncharacterized integral membrane protein
MDSLKSPRTWPPGAFFCLDAFMIIVLLGLGLGFASGVLPELHHSGRPDAAFLSVIPYWVPWAGALGGISISLVGVVGYAGNNWNPSRYGYWHLARPFLGAMFGTIAVLIIVLVLKTVTNTDSTNLSTPAANTPQGVGVLCVFAFVVGFREETFRSLVLRVVDVILGPGISDTTATVAFVPAILDFQPVVPGVDPPSTGTVHLFNGSGDSLHVTQTSIQCGDPSLSVDPPIADTLLAPAQSLKMTIVWTPAVRANPLNSYVSVNTGNRAARLIVTGGVN